MKNSGRCHLIFAIFIFFLLFFGTISGITILIEKKMPSLVIGGIFILFFAVYIYFVVDFLFIKKLEKLANESIEKKFDSGRDLTLRLSIEKTDSIGMFRKHLNIFVARIHDIIAKLKLIANDNSKIGKELASQAEMMSNNIYDISTSIKNIENNENKLGVTAKESKVAVDDINNSIKLIVEHIEGQSASISESSSAIEELIASIKNINNISGSKKQLVDKLNVYAKKGHENMLESLESIKKIEDSAGVIKELIKVINSVSNQTSLLAMNAAIEAAHAGEHGKGFTVVADEIRQLAETTSGNVKNITENLNKIIVNIQEASNKTEKTEESISEMTEGFQEVADSFNEIISGLGEMSAGTEQITIALRDLSFVTEKVKGSSVEIEDKSKTIDASINNVAMLSENSNNSISKIAESIQNIVQLTSSVKSLGVTNSENIRFMEDEISMFKTIDTSHLTSSDNQPLIIWNNKDKEVPPRPDDPKKFSEDDERYWYDLEYSGFGMEKVNIPESKADGSQGKKIIWVRPGEHPYYTAQERGMKKICDAFDIDVLFYFGDWTEGMQANLVNKVIKEKPDFIVLTPINTTTSTEWFKKINESGIPVTACTSAPAPEAFKYILSFSGADTWGQSRLLAQKLAEFLNYEGQYCIVQHAIGNSLYYGRTYSITTELKKIAPKMKYLDMQSTNLEFDKTKEVVTEWINKYGTDLRGIVIGDAGDPLEGTIEAIKYSKRNDIINVTTGNCKLSLDYMKDDKLHAIAWQSAECDGALPVEIAINWFNGLEINPIKYLPNLIITKDVVENYYPPQW